jgi:DNA-binding transcriptional ArsR family regulator
MDPLDRTLAALADPARRRAVELLQAGPRRPSELAEALDLARPAMSRHLRVLREAGLIEAEALQDDARGRQITLKPAALAELRDWAARTEALWTDQLAAFARYAEAAPSEAP